MTDFTSLTIAEKISPRCVGSITVNPMESDLPRGGRNWRATPWNAAPMALLRVPTVCEKAVLSITSLRWDS